MPFLLKLRETCLKTCRKVRPFPGPLDGLPQQLHRMDPGEHPPGWAQACQPGKHLIQQVRQGIFLLDRHQAGILQRLLPVSRPDLVAHAAGFRFRQGLGPGLPRQGLPVLHPHGAVREEQAAQVFAFIVVAVAGKPQDHRGNAPFSERFFKQTLSPVDAEYALYPGNALDDIV